MSRLGKIALLIFVAVTSCCADDNKRPKFKWPTVVISILIRNKAHTLPYFFTSLHNIDYPKDRIYLWIYSDYNEDNTIQLIHEWVQKFGSEYAIVNVTKNTSSPRLHSDAMSSTHWSSKHFEHVIKLREESLNVARNKWADYIFMIDADVFLVESTSLKNLIHKNYTVVAPMLMSDGLYSNFWCGMTENYYYKRTDEYKPILERTDPGCFSVPMVHTAVLINLRHSDSDMLTYDPRNIDNYLGPKDDIIAFAINAKNRGIPLHVCNDELYGYVTVPLEENVPLSNDNYQLQNIKLEAISRGTPLKLNEYLAKHISYPTPHKYGCSEIYMINLERRAERRKLMEQAFKELGMDVTIFKAVDGKELDMQHLSKSGVTLLPNYEDPYYKRPMKAGEIGCFLSHYRIWEEVSKNAYETTLVLEDDVHFVPYFKNKFYLLLEEIKNLDWDLVYIGRKILIDSEEEYVTEHIVKPLYSYWTLGYLVSLKGARKLLDAKPLSKVLPVDEYLPIMFDKNPNDEWKSHFPVRNLNAFSSAPLLIHPTHYTGQDGYVSDTEDSNIVHISDNPYAKNEL